MQSNELRDRTVDETVKEISLILAQGYMRYRKGRRIAADSGDIAEDMPHSAETETCSEKRLDSDGNDGVR